MFLHMASQPGLLNCQHEGYGKLISHGEGEWEVLFFFSSCI